MYIPGVMGYEGQNVPLLVKRYESISFEEVHKPIIDLLPSGGAHVLDIGSGSGRDSIALAKRRLKVIAVEPSDDMRAFAEKRHEGENVMWLDDALPNLATVKRLHQKFDFILASAVWMHLEWNERKYAMRTVAELMKNNALIAISLRCGPISRSRRMFQVSVQETASFAELWGLTVVRCVQCADPLGRHGICWRHVCIRKESHENYSLIAT